MKQYTSAINYKGNVIMRKIGIEQISLYDLMAEDFCLHLSQSNQGYNLHLEGYDPDSPEVEEENIHPCAIDSLADFCTKFLGYYNKLNTAA